MKKLSIILAALVLVLLCGCAADPAPAQDLDEAEQTAAEPVRVATFTADILSAGGDLLMVSPESGSFADASATSVAVQLAEGLVPTGADGWPIAISELSPELCVDITYLGDPTPGNPAEVIAVAIRVDAGIDLAQPTGQDLDLDRADRRRGGHELAIHVRRAHAVGIDEQEMADA